VHILVIEDNRADAHLIKTALRNDPFCQVTIVEDGRAAMAYLRREEPYKNASHSDLMLLDLNLPYKTGREVLAECKADPALRHIPVIILTSTQADTEVRRLYELGAAAYCVKPTDLDDYLSLIQMIAEFWGRRAHLTMG